MHQYCMYLSVIISTIVDSAITAENAALFMTAQVAMLLQMTLTELGYLQSATPIIYSNQCTLGISNNSFTQNGPKQVACATTGSEINIH